MLFVVYLYHLNHSILFDLAHRLIILISFHSSWLSVFSSFDVMIDANLLRN